jgi:peptide/nickel transport system substrate-binding protein
MRLSRWWPILLWLLVGCSQPQDEVIRFGLAAAPANLDPRFATDASSARINRLLYARLVDFDDASRPVPSLARWQRIDPLHYRFVLGTQGRRFHNGARLTAGDVAATYASILDPATGSPHRGTLALIERIEVLDDDRLDFHLQRADPLFPAYLVIGIVPAEAIAQGWPLHDHPLGSGPLRLQAWPETGRLRLRRDADRQLLEFLEVKDPTVRVLKLLRGELDLIQNDLPAELVRYLAAQPQLQVQRRPGSNFAYLGFNLQDAATADLHVRRAIAHAIDRRAVIRHVLGGAARPAAALLPPDHWAGDPQLAPLEYDPALARAELARAGYGPQHPLRLTYKTSADPLRLRIATVFQRQLAEVGIEVALQSYDWGTFYGDIKAGRFQLYSLAWVGIKTPDIFRYAFHSASLPPEGANRGRLADAGVDALIAAAESATELEEQARAWRALQARLLEQLPYVPLWYEDHVVASRRDLVGYRLAADGNYDGLQWVRREGRPAAAETESPAHGQGDGFPPTMKLP